MLHPVSQPYQQQVNTMTQRAVRKPKPSVANHLRPSFPQRHWLELAEYASLAASGVGSLAVAVSGQAFYGVAPLTLALSLNVANRYRFEQQVRVHQNSEMAQVQKSVNKVEKTAVTVIVKLRKQLSADIAALRQQMAAMPRAEGFEESIVDIQRQLLSLGESVASLQEIVASAVLDVRQQVSEQLQDLSLGQRANLQAVEQAIEQLQSAMQGLAETSITRDDWEAVNTRFLEIQKVMANLQSQLQAPAHQSTADLSLVQAQIHRLEHEQQEVVKPHLKRLISVVKELQHTQENRQ
ncbi:hypothetical protein Osc7112_2712 [Oscillatoria nigro-viridis PCC 7112]|uniref:Uncharacterized protein n=2 Tax=Phormidium nigroviride TaxID=482564 RepID=K9VIT7_9CYAN|nr:hypothetical protein [Oscillatoria nigro-viridis]AFZ07125.1 hypothetical protein Osc7112_2712 [Oscillatoria nigro-viridis PCC 7112]